MPDKPPDQSEAPHAGQRLTRADVERLIAEHGGPEGLDLRGADLQHSDLRKLDLHEADLREANLNGALLQEAVLEGAKLDNAHLVGGADLRGAWLEGASLQGARLWRANLQAAELVGANLREADLTWSNLSSADLRRANLEAARLCGAHLLGAYLEWARLRHVYLHGVGLGNVTHPNTGRTVATDLANADWGDYVIGEELAGEFEQAEAVYRMLKEWHRQHGHYDVASEFTYRENVVRTKAMGQQATQEWDKVNQQARKELQALTKSWGDLIAPLRERWMRLIHR
ncbi:MAG TPA: pentapeptide repeat-containing protein [Dehalococcoidia bacterium]|nr:pentapeptide repeat-containing protein [Dehalococcoidia bacterium]